MSDNVGHIMLLIIDGCRFSTEFSRSLLVHDADFM